MAFTSVQKLLPVIAFWGRIKTWRGKASLAVMDQGVMTGSNFVVGILLARWLAPAEYGAYAIAYAVFLLLSLLFQALILEPMSIFGPSTYRERLPVYLGVLVRASTGLALLLFAILATCAFIEYWLLQNRVLALALSGVAVATPCIILLWLARNAFYVQLSPLGSAVGSVAYSTCLLVGIFVLQRCGRSSPSGTFLLMALAGLATASLQMLRLKPRCAATSDLSMRTVAHAHWNYGRWILASSFVVWIPSNVYYLIFSGPAMMLPAAELRALLNLTLPVGQTATALTLLLQPYAAQRQDLVGAASLTSLVRRITVLYAAGATAYWVILIAFRTQALHLLYGNKYVDLSPLLPLVALSSILAVAAHGPGVGLRAIRSPASVFTAFLVSTAISLLIGVPVTLAFGAKGSVMTLSFVNAVALVLVLRSFYGRVQRLSGVARTANMSGRALSPDGFY